jgi:hypothetical protein
MYGRRSAVLEDQVVVEPWSTACTQVEISALADHLLKTRCHDACTRPKYRVQRRGTLEASRGEDDEQDLSVLAASFEAGDVPP